MSNKNNIQKLVYTALLAALAGVLMTLEFNIPFFPPFYAFSTIFLRHFPFST